MSTEPGERRRRRELEREREHAALQAAAPKAPAVVTPPAPVLSRRELRDLERAHSAQELAAAAPKSPVPVAPKKVSPEAVAPKPVAPKPVAPKQVAPKPVAPKPVAPEPVAPEAVVSVPVAPTPTAVRRSYSKEAGPVSGGAPVDATQEQVVTERAVTRQSRRSMRPQPGPTETARTPVVNPPATTGTIRIVVPEETANDRPARTEGSFTPGRGFPPVAPRRSALSPLVSSAGRSPAPPRPSPSATPPSATPPSATPPSAGGGDFAWPTKAAPDSEQAPGSDRSGADDVVAAPPDQAPAHPARAGGAPLAPRWGHVPSGSFDAITRPPDDEEHPPAPVRSMAEAKDTSPARRSAAYTWLQMLALALLAFVLGFIVWLLIKGSTEPGATGAPAPASTTSSSGTSWPHLGDL